VIAKRSKDSISPDRGRCADVSCDSESLPLELFPS